MKILSIINIDENDYKAVCSVFKELISDVKYEVLLIAYIGQDSKTVTLCELDSGNFNMVIHDCTDILQYAYLLSSKRIFLAHNHPNGIATPSEQDLISTERIKSLLYNNGITLIDHYIVTEKGCHSVFAFSL